MSVSTNTKLVGLKVNTIHKDMHPRNQELSKKLVNLVKDHAKKMNIKILKDHNANLIAM